MTEFERHILARLSTTEWMKPAEVGGCLASNHARVLRRLVTKGLVEQRRRNTPANRWQPLRGSFEYRKVEK